MKEYRTQVGASMRPGGPERGCEQSPMPSIARWGREGAAMGAQAMAAPQWPEAAVALQRRRVEQLQQAGQLARALQPQLAAGAGDGARGDVTSSSGAAAAHALHKCWLAYAHAHAPQLSRMRSESSSGMLWHGDRASSAACGAA